MKDEELENKIEEMLRSSAIIFDDGINGAVDKSLFKMKLREAILFGQERMRSRAVACVPEKKMTYRNKQEHDKVNAFNDCHEQVLSALGKL